MLTTFIMVWCQIILFAGVSTLNVLLYPISKNASRKLSDLIVKHCASLIFPILCQYKRFRVFNYKQLKNELPEQFLIISNHQSLLDIPLYMSFLRNHNLRFVAKAELARHVPLISEVLRSQEHCMIPRSGNASFAMYQLDKFATRVAGSNQVPVLFPEGTRSRDGSLGKFYSAGFRRLIERVPLPVAVCAIDGGYRISSLGGIMKNMQNGSYRIKILKIYPAPHSKQEQLHILEEGHALVQAQLDEWRKQ